MNSVTVLLIALLLAAVGAVWYLVSRYLRTASSLDSGKSSASELEAFIAAYRSGRVDPNSLQVEAQNGESVQSSPSQEAAPTTPAVAPAVTMAAPAVAASAPVAAGPPASRALLRPEVKLAYLSLRAGLRDHHVFPNIPLSDLAEGNMPGRTDLVVCAASFEIVAAIDVSTGPSASEPGREEFLRAAGIRHLHINVKAMPRPGELRGLLYPE